MAVFLCLKVNLKLCIKTLSYRSANLRNAQKISDTQIWGTLILC
nr:MAG TPA: hypothetical protein [Caudoviricetes sp.]